MHDHMDMSNYIGEAAACDNKPMLEAIMEIAIVRLFENRLAVEQKAKGG